MQETRSQGRLVGIDLARSAALISMYIAHTAPSPGPGGVLNLSEFLTAPLFALLLGASAALSAQRMAFPALFASSVVRGIALIALGLWIGGWGAQVDIVLEYLGLLSLVMAPLVYLPAWVLGLVAAGAFWFAQEARAYFVADYQAALAQGSYWSYFYDWAFTGHNYQVLTLLTYACVGAILAPALLTWTAAAEAVLAVAATGVTGLIFWYSRTAVPEFLPYTSTRLEIAFSLAASVAVLAWCLLLGRALGGQKLLAPFLAAGRMTLSLYVLQVGLLALYTRNAAAQGWPVSDDSWLIMGGLILVSLLFAGLWERLLGATPFRRGPLETPLAWVSGRG